MVKNKKSELFFIKAVILFAAVFCAVFIPRSAYAATTLKKLEPNKIYKTYDFNRDGKKDSFKYSFSNPRGKAIIYLNGRRSTADTVRSANLYYYRYSKSNEFLMVNYSYFGGSDIDVYMFKGNTLKKVQALPESAFTCNLIKYAANNILAVETHPYRQKQFLTMSDCYTYVPFRQIYKLDTKKHRFVLGSRYLKPTKSAPLVFITADADLYYTTSNTPTAYNKKGVRLISYQDYEIKQIYLWKRRGNRHVLRVQLVNSKGRTGWINDSNKRQFY